MLICADVFYGRPLQVAFCDSLLDEGEDEKLHDEKEDEGPHDRVKGNHFVIHELL